MQRLARISAHLHDDGEEETITLTDTAKGIYLDAFQMDKGGFSVRKHRLKGGLQDNVDVVEVSNGIIKATVLPTRGMTIHRVELLDPAVELSLGWESPVKGPVHPSYVNLEDNKGLGWLYSFNGWMVRCGVEFSGHPGEDSDGRLLSLHGKIAHIPSSVVNVKFDEKHQTLYLRGKVDEVWFKGANFELWTELALHKGSKTFGLTDRLTNHSAKTQEFTMLYHANYGRPILGEGARILGTFSTVQAFDDEALKDIENWQRYQGPGYVKPGGERLYCVVPFGDKADNDKCKLVFHDPAASKGIAISYDVKSLPYLSVWKNEDTVKNGYVTGIEPGTSFPPNRRVERKAGRLATIEPNETRVFEMRYTMLSKPGEVSAAARDIQKLVRVHGPAKLLKEPLPKD